MARERNDAREIIGEIEEILDDGDLTDGEKVEAIADLFEGEEQED